MYSLPLRHRTDERLTRKVRMQVGRCQLSHGLPCLSGGALVTEGKSFPDGSLIVGSPAVAKRELNVVQIAGLLLSAERYVQNAQDYAQQGLKKV